LTVVGADQGPIQGSVTVPGRENSIRVVAFTNEVASQVTSAAGGRRPSGRRQFGPVTITKEVDCSSPLLHTMHTHGEVATEWRLDFWQPSPSGQEQRYYTIELSKAMVVGFGTEMLNNTLPENVSLAVREHVRFAYAEITWTWHDGGITATDGQ
jgi:type VI secretion system secreted protein Hcp